MKKIIEQIVLESVEKTLPQTRLKDYSIEIPKEPGFGDYSSSVAFALAKTVNQDPQDIAQTLAKALRGRTDLFEKVEVGGGGFVNLTMTKNFWLDELKHILQAKENYGKQRMTKGKKASVEFISANPTGPLHVGNARGGPIGDVVANVLEFVGYQVTREYYHNDVGGQIDQLGETIYAHKHPSSGLEPGYRGGYVQELAKKIPTRPDLAPDEEKSLYAKEAVKILFEEILADVKSMGIDFDLVTKESDLRSKTESVIKILKKRGVTIEKDGAQWLASQDEFLKDRESVLIKSDGSYTYFANDIAYHLKKFGQSPDLVVDVLGANHHGHVPRLKAAIMALGLDVNRYRAVVYQQVRVKRGDQIVKMSKRAGNFITAREVIEEVDRDAFRFFMLMHDANTHLDFDLELAKQQSKVNPVYYVQYAAVRLKSILSRAPEQLITKLNAGQSVKLAVLSQPKELQLIKKISLFPELIVEISQSLKVHQLVHYVWELAGLVHDFYEQVPVLGFKRASNQPELTAARLALVKAGLIGFDQCFQLLGISSPSRM